MDFQRLHVFRQQWLEQKDTNGDVISEWCKKTKEATILNCVWCKVDLNISSKGPTALKQHSEGSKHKQQRGIVLRNMKLFPSPSATTSKPVSISSQQASSSSSLQTATATESTKGSHSTQPTLALFLPGTTTISKEILWTIHMSMKNSPDAEADNDSKILRRLAPNDLKGFSLSRTKLAYMKRAVGDWFWETVVMEDLKGSFYTLMFDDTTNVQQKKELQLVLKYWSRKLQGLNYVHLRTSFLSSGKAVPALNEIKAAIKENNLPTNLLVQLGCDGPNVTISVKNKCNEWLQKEENLRKLFDLGSCHDHNLHNAFKKGCEEMPNVHVLCQQVSEYFKTALHWENFTSETGATLKFVNFFSVRWATLGPSTARIIQMWDHLKAFFLTVSQKLEKDITKIEKKIISLLASDIIKAETMFVSYVASIVEPVLTFLERQDQLTYQADDRYLDMLEHLIAIVLMPGQAPFKKVVKNKAFDKAVLKFTKITLPENIRQAVPASETDDFDERVLNFIGDLVAYLTSKQFFHTFLYDVKFLSPKYIFRDGSIEKILAIAEYFKTHNQDIDKTKLFEELTLFVSPRNQELFKDLVDIDKFFVAVDETGKFTELFKVFRLASTVTISNAEVERNFSRSKMVITKHMSNLQEGNFNARKRIISGMKFFGDDIENFPITTLLISKVHLAHRDYKRKMDDQKKQDEGLKNRQRLDEALTSQIQESQIASQNYSTQMESAISEAGKISKDLEVEQKALSNFLNCMGSCKDQDRIHQLVKDSKLSAATISTLEKELSETQAKILKLQSDRIKKLTR